MDERTRSVWIDSYPGRPFPALLGDLSVDVAIVGGGITGITAALLLERAGLSVAVIEALEVGRANTGLTTAHLTAVLDSRWHTLIDKFGRDGARLAADAQRAAIDRIEALIREHELDCGFARVPGWLYSESSKDRAELERELEAATELGFECSFIDDVPLPFEVDCGLRFENQARFHPREYLMPLASLIPGRGSFVFENTRVLEIDDGEPCRVTTEGGVVTAKEVIVAAHVPVSNRIFLHTKLAAYRSYVLGAYTKEPIPDGLYWDTDDPYHYLRVHPFEDRPLLIAGGADHKVGQEGDARRAFAELTDYLRDRFGQVEIAHRWSGQIIETLDGLPYVGRNSLSDHVYVATGYSGNGMTNGTIAAMLISDLILDRQNPWAELFDATRIKPIASVRRFLAENVDFPAHLVGDRLKRPDARSFMEVPHGEGRIVDHGGRKLAVYRDQRGDLSVMSAVCTHLGCIVHWNTVEKSWDCPCHGSRFECTGEVLAGPAVTPLQPMIDTDELTPTSPDAEESEPVPAYRRWKLVAD